MNLIFPPHCVLCQELLPMGLWEDGVCKGCRESIPFLVKDRCPKCGRKAAGGCVCESCQEHEPVCAMGYAVFSYAQMRDEISRLKFQNDLYGGKALGRLMAEYVISFHPEVISWADMITAVPLHPRKERERGFNQVSILCEEMAKVLPVKYESDILMRIRDTAPQNALGLHERRQNIKGAFRADGCENKCVLLVDDILTTGATTNECARALYRAGAKEVRVLYLSATERIEEDR